MPRRGSSGGRSGGYGGYGGGYGRSGGGYGRTSGGAYRTYSSSRPSSTGPKNTSYQSSQRTAQPNQAHQTTIPVNPQRGMGLGGALATGMAFGGGSAIGHSLIGGLMGSRGGGHTVDGGSQNLSSGEVTSPSEQQIQQEAMKNPCFDFGQKFVTCLKEYSNDIARCQNIFDDMKNCERILYKI